MRKIITFLVVAAVLMIPIKVYADSAAVEILVNGEIKKESNIEILVNVKDVSKMYAASVNFTYDINQLKVNSIKATDFITKYSDEIMELGGETDKNGNTASYSFTFLGDKEGVSGTNTLVIIDATVLKDGDLHINSDNMEVKLVQRSGSDVINYPFKFSEYTTKKDDNSSSTNKPTISEENKDKNTTTNVDSGNSNSSNASGGSTQTGGENNTSTEVNESDASKEDDDSKDTDNTVENTNGEENLDNLEEDKLVEKNNSLNIKSNSKNTKGLIIGIVSVVAVISIGSGVFIIYKKRK